MLKWIELALFIALLLATFPLLGRYMAAIFRDGAEPSYPLLGWIEKSIYRLCGVDPGQEMNWKNYVKALLYFNLFGFLFLFFLQLAQGWLPLNPEHFPGVEPALAFNTAVSFVTNTNWQAYGGENTMSYLTQMLGMTVQNFVSAATGNAALLAMIRGITRQSSQTIGNFWKDMTRTVVYLLLPLSLIFAFILVSQGVIQTFGPYVHAATLEKESQTIPLGPVASQIAIKQLGTNGGGFLMRIAAIPLKIPPRYQIFWRPLPFSGFLQPQLTCMD